MRKILLSFMLSLGCAMAIHAQGMSDKAVIQFIASETKAGTPQAQIVTKLVQRGVSIETIRRLRNQYDEEVNSRGRDRAAAGTVTQAADRMEANGDGTTGQELTTAKRGTTGEVYFDAQEDVEEVEHDVKATQGVAADAIGKRVFGRDIFNHRALSFEPNSNMPTPSSYVLGPGDQVVVDIYGASQETLVHTISPEGTITVSGYGPIALSGLTVEQAQARLRNTVGSQFESSSMRVTVGNTRTIMVNILGEVNTPGTYHLSAYATVFYALYRAGGIGRLGTLRNVKVYRNGRLVTIVDIYEYLLNGRLAGNINLQDNDVIQVDPYESLVGITGNVKRPMFYEMRKDETVATLLKYAGGFTGDAHRESVRLVRQTGERYQVYNIGEFDMAGFKVEDGDAITVDGMINRFENMVEVKGAVFRPGQFRLGETVNSVKTLLQAADGVTEDAFTAHAVMHRLKADRSLEIVPIDVQGILDGTVPDVALQNEDVLFIPTSQEMRRERSLTITGEVFSPGTYEFADNTTIEDLIVQAGGLTDRASLARVDVSRRIIDPHATEKTREISQNFTFDIKDGLVISGDRSFLLEPYDVVHVRRSPVFHTPRHITITGEVNYEGTHTMKDKNMRLSDAIEMAGGVTSDAYLRGARLVRRLNDEERVRERATLLAVRDLLTEKRDSLVWHNMDLENNYPVAIDLEQALNNPGCDADILLREGDRIFIPEYNPIVKIAGDVMFPNTVYYESGKNYKYYVRQAGGFGHRAKKSKAFIVYQNGQVGLVKNGAKPEPGCEVVIPSKRHRNPINLAPALGMTSTFASLATIIVALTKL